MAKKEKTESVRINRELMKQLRVIAAERGCMLSWQVNQALSQWLAIYESSKEKTRLG